MTGSALFWPPRAAPGKHFMKSLSGLAKKIVVVSGPSGAGKTLFIQKTLEMYPRFQNTVTYTTRPPREGELAQNEGGGAAAKFYHFVSPKEFDRLEERGELAERAWVHGQRYGTAHHELERLWRAGKSIIKDLDIQGARSIKKIFPQAVTVFIYPPSLSELRRRLIKRGTEGKEALRERLSAAEEEMAEGRWFDFKITNDDFEEAWREFQAILLPLL